MVDLTSSSHFTGAEKVRVETEISTGWANSNPVLLVQTINSFRDEVTKAKLNMYVYDARDPTARRLADWWEEHQAADRERELQEAQQAERSALLASARSKLTKEEWEALR